MTATFYTEGLRQLLENGDWVSGDYRVCLVEAAYTFSAAHTAMTDVTNQVVGAARTDAVALSSRAYLDVTNGTGLDSADYTFTSVPSGDTIDAAVVFKGGGTAATDVPLCYIDEDSGAAAISVPTNGNNVTITVGADGWATITRS